VCHPTSRGEALLLGATHWNRSNTDGNTFLSYSLRRAGYEVLIERINLYGNVTMYPFHIQLLSALVVRDFIVQDTESGYLSLGPCLQNFAANYEQPFAASDIVAFLLDCEVLAAQSWGGINRAQCWEGIDHAKALMRLPLDERLCAKYGLPTPERILSAGRFPPVYSVDMHIQDKNLGYVLKKERTMVRVVKGELPAVRVVCVDPSLGVQSPKSFVFPSALVRRIRSAGLRELEELARQEPCRSLFEDAAYLSARLPVRSGLRSGASHPQYVPSISALPDIFKGEFWSNGSYCSTLLMAIGVEYQTVDGEPLCSKGETPPLQLVGAARAKRDSMVRAAGGGTEHVEHLRAADAYRDVLFKQVVPMLGAPLRDIRSVICDCVVAAAVAKDAKAALKEAAKAARGIPKPSGRAPKLGDGSPAAWDPVKGEWIGVKAAKAAAARAIPKPRGRAPKLGDGSPAAWDPVKGEWIGVKAAKAAAASRKRKRDAEDAYWMQALSDIWGVSRKEQAADLAAVPGGYGLSSTARLWRPLSRYLDEDAS